MDTEAETELALSDELAAKVENAGNDYVIFRTTPLTGQAVELYILYPKVINTDLKTVINIRDVNANTFHMFVDLPNTKQSRDMFVHIAYLVKKYETAEAFELVAEFLAEHDHRCCIQRKTSKGRETKFLVVKHTNPNKGEMVTTYYITSNRR